MNLLKANTIVSFAGGLLFMASPIAHSDLLGVNFTDAQDVIFGSGVSAGAPGFVQANWNHMNTDWSGSAGNDALFTAGLTDSLGVNISGSILQDISYAPHADPVHYDANNTWRSGAGNSTADHTLLNGYLDDAGDNQPYLNLSLSASVIGGVTVVLYINGVRPDDSTGRYWIEEWTDPLAEGTVITDQIGIAALGSGFSGTYTQVGGANFSQTGTPVNQDVSAGHYLIFDNITARNIRIRGAGNGDPEDFGRSPLNAVQVMYSTIPEPSSLGLMLLGLLGLSRFAKCKLM